MGHNSGNEQPTMAVVSNETCIEACDCRRAARSLCRHLRPVLEDAGNYIRFITEKLESDPSQEFYREARVVVLTNISEALNRIEELLSAPASRISIQP